MRHDDPSGDGRPMALAPGRSRPAPAPDMAGRFGARRRLGRRRMAAWRIYAMVRPLRRALALALFNFGRLVSHSFWAPTKDPSHR